LSPRRRADLETRRIEWLSGRLGAPASTRVVLGVGDDAALWRPRPGTEVVLTTDAQIEGTHFERAWIAPRDLGRRAIAAAVSDVAAMGGRPAGLLVSLALPADLDERFFRALWSGIDAEAREVDAPILGGNTSRGELSITTTALGEVKAGAAMHRAPLVVGDEIWTTGCPGLARLGYLHLSDGLFADCRTRSAAALVRRAERAFRRPRARVAESLALTRTWSPRAMIDLSDGLGRDLGHMTEAHADGGEPAVGVEIDADAIRALDPLAALCRLVDLDPLDIALAGGEDYELCAVIPAARTTSARIAALRRRFATPWTRVGRVVREEGLWIRAADGSREAAEAHGFEHF